MIYFWPWLRCHKRFMIFAIIIVKTATVVRYPASGEWTGIFNNSAGIFENYAVSDQCLTREGEIPNSALKSLEKLDGSFIPIL